MMAPGLQAVSPVFPAFGVSLYLTVQTILHPHCTHGGAVKEKLTNRRLSSLEVTGKEYEIHDTVVPGLFVRVTAAGAKSFVVTWARGRKKALGHVSVLTLDQARQEALQYLNEARTHGEPLAITQGRKGSTVPTLERFLDDHFEPWALAHQARLHPAYMHPSD